MNPGLYFLKSNRFILCVNTILQYIDAETSIKNIELFMIENILLMDTKDGPHLVSRYHPMVLWQQTMIILNDLLILVL